MPFSPPPLDTLEPETGFTPPPLESLEPQGSIPSEIADSEAQQEIERNAGRNAPDWLQKTAGAVNKAAKGFVEPLVPTYSGGVPMLNPEAVGGLATPVVGAARDALTNYRIAQDVAGGMSLEQATRKNAPEQLMLADADKTPAGSQERYDAGIEMIAQLAMGAGISKGLKAEGPKVVEPVKTTQEGLKEASPDSVHATGQMERNSAPTEASSYAPTQDQALQRAQSEQPPKQSQQETFPQPNPIDLLEKKQEQNQGLKEADANAEPPTGQNAPLAKIAIRMPDGKIFTGFDHASALEDASKVYPDFNKLEPQAIRGWLDTDGNFLDREQAHARAQSIHQNGLIKASGPEKSTIQHSETELSEVSHPQSESSPTSTKNANTSTEREARGIPEAVEAARRDFGTVWDEAEKVAAEDPSAGQRLVAEINDKPRALSDLENAHLLRRQIEVQAEHDAAVKGVNDNPGDTAAQTRLDAARDSVQAVYDAAKSAGTETGRGLNARKMLANADFTLAKMEAETRAVANSGSPLSPKQATEVRTLHARIASAEARIAAYEAREQFQTALQTAKKTRLREFRPQTFLEEQAVKARERINARRSKLYADPVGVTQIAHLADEAIIGAAHISRGVRNFADWSQTMLSEFGDRIKPYLKALFAKAQQMHTEAAKVGRLSPEQREANALAGEKRGIVTRTEKLRTKTETGDFEPAPKKQPRMDHEKSLLLYEYQKAREAYLQGLIKSKLAKQSVPRKALRYGGEVLNTARAIMTSFDLSAVLRQGGFSTFGHPIRTLKNFPDMIRAFGSEKAQFRINEELKARPNAPLYKQSGLYVAEEGVSLSKMEEAYMSRWAKKIPVVAGSERAYVTFLNKVRADSFDSLYKNLGGKERVSPQEAKAIANFVNVTTGRGNMGGAAQAAVALNTAFFAPRYVVSRFQTLLGQPMYGGTMRTRFAIAKEYGRFLAGAATVYALGKAAGATVETDPRSSDFGKLKFGNTRVDPLAGLSQSTVLLSRLGSGETKTGGGKIVPIRGDKVPYGSGNSADVIARFLRTKLSPAIGGAIDLLAGKNVVGQPVTAASTAKQMMVPLSFGDITAAMKEQGVEKGTALAIAALFGMGVTNYAPKQPKTERKMTLEEAMRERRLKQIEAALQQSGRHP